MGNGVCQRLFSLDSVAMSETFLTIRALANNVNGISGMVRRVCVTALHIQICDPNIHILCTVSLMDLMLSIRGQHCSKVIITDRDKPSTRKLSRVRPAE